MISTKHSTEMVEVRKKNDVSDKAMVVVDYNRGKCAADLSDRTIVCSTPRRRTLEGYIKLALELLLNTSISNAMILYKQARKTKIELSDFRMALATHLTQCHSPEPSNILIRQRLRREMQKKGQAYVARKFCKEWYKKNVKQLGWKIAKNRTKKVTTYRPDCIDEPRLCLKRFNTVHR